ncbi:MAG TPA: cysteine-rich CWC family protein [Verrucomicrobiae bacterium]
MKIDPSKCPLCGKTNNCGIAKGSKDCWCMIVKIPAHRLLEIPVTHTGKACLCQECATATAPEK